jgi:hypothetical protein
MTTDDPWAVPQARDESAAPAAEPASRPVQAPAAHHGSFDAAGAGITGQRPRRITSDPLLRTASGLLVGSTLTRVWGLFTHIGNNPPRYEYVSEFALQAYILILTLTVAVLLLLPKTREVAKGAVIAFAVILLTRDFRELRPSAFNAQQGRSVHWALDAGFALVVAAAVLVVIRVLRDPRSPRDRQSRADRIAAVLGGLLGAVLWTVATLLAWAHFTERLEPAAPATTTDCCGWIHADNWDRAVFIATDVGLLLLALLAATGRSRTRCVGLMLGTTLLLAADLLDSTIGLLAPVASAYGANRVDQATRRGLELTISPLAGYWVAILAVAVFAVVGTLRYTLTPRRAPYPELRPRPPRR